MNRWTLREFPPASGLSCLFIGREKEPRPDPGTLLPWRDRSGRPLPLLTLSQVHSGRCLTVGAAQAALGPGRHPAGEGDALVTSHPGLALGIATADCLPLVAADLEAGVLGVVHAGWRGTLAGVLQRTLDAMTGRLGARPERILIGAGPAAGPCCYEVGEDVLEAFRAARPAEASRLFVNRAGGGKRSFDLVQANRSQAEAFGIPPERFEAVGPCTICSAGSCHSYRRDGSGAGRNWLLAALLPAR